MYFIIDYLKYYYKIVKEINSKKNYKKDFNKIKIIKNLLDLTN